MLFLSTTFLSYLTAYVLFLLVECPVGNIEKRLFMPKGVMAAAEQTANGHSRAGHEKRSNGHSNGAFSDIAEKIDVEDSHDKPVVVARF